MADLCSRDLVYDDGISSHGLVLGVDLGIEACGRAGGRVYVDEKNTTYRRRNTRPTYYVFSAQRATRSVMAPKGVSPHPPLGVNRSTSPKQHTFRASAPATLFSFETAKPGRT